MYIMCHESLYVVYGATLSDKAFSTDTIIIGLAMWLWFVLIMHINFISVSIWVRDNRVKLTGISC